MVQAGYGFGTSVDGVSRKLLVEFESLQLDPAAMSHELHIRLAWAALQQYPLLEAVDRQTSSLQKFVDLHGESEKFHVTVTWAYLLLIQERIARRPAASWEQFAESNSDLFERGEGGVLRRYYRSDTLSSPLAREHFVFPDLQPTGQTS